mgnify:CR=1 FL=1
MAKVARAAYNASKMRTESITGDKTCAASETGELYFVNYNTGATITVTLPPLKDGAYVKFIWATSMSTNSSVIDFKVPEGTAGVLRGYVRAQEIDGSGGMLGESNISNAVKFSVGDNTAEPQIGSMLEAYCDGTSWHLSGLILTPAATTANNAIAWGT